jgi:hypothetical protein
MKQGKVDVRRTSIPSGEPDIVAGLSTDFREAEQKGRRARGRRDVVGGQAARPAGSPFLSARDGSWRQTATRPEPLSSLELSILPLLLGRLTEGAVRADISADHL